jgi:hypothetical protein
MKRLSVSFAAPNADKTWYEVTYIKATFWLKNLKAIWDAVNINEKSFSRP